MTLDTIQAGQDAGLRLSLIGERAGDQILRRARKLYRCQMPRVREGHVVRRWDGGEIPAGHGDIAVGDVYVEDVGNSSPYESGLRYCAACSVAAGLAVYTSRGTPQPPSGEAAQC